MDEEAPREGPAGDQGGREEENRGAEEEGREMACRAVSDRFFSPRISGVGVFFPFSLRSFRIPNSRLHGAGLTISLNNGSLVIQRSISNNFFARC